MHVDDIDDLRSQYARPEYIPIGSTLLERIVNQDNEPNTKHAIPLRQKLRFRPLAGF